MNVAEFVERCIGREYLNAVKVLEAHGFYQNSPRSTRKGDNGVTTWWHSHNEWRGRLVIEHTWVEFAPGMSRHGKIVSATWTPSMRGENVIR